MNFIDYYKILGINNKATASDIKIAGHGGAGINGGPNGDLYITFSIANHSDIKRLGNDLYVHADIDLYTAVLAGEITIDALSGKVKLKVKPETQNGLIEIRTIESKYFVEKEQLPKLEKFVRFYYDLDINLEGIEAITYLLQRIENLQNEIVVLKNRLRLYEG